MTVAQLKLDNANHDFICVGLNHHKTPVEIREQAAFNDLNVDDALAALLDHKNISEAAILSTCNRVELYAHGDVEAAQNSLSGFLHKYHKLPLRALTPHMYCFNGIAAVAQLFRVTTSLDSLIVGEPQILGQVKNAYLRAQNAGALGPLLTQAFSQAFFTAKRVRNETNIGKNAVTVSFAAVELAQKVFGKLDGINCVLIGAGETSELAALHFKQKGAKITVVNRSLDNASLLAKKYSCQAFDLAKITELLEFSDVVLASTNAANFLLTKEMMQKVMRQRRYRPIFLIDISVPRNIDPQVNLIDGIYLYNIDDLTQIVATNFNVRRKESIFAETIIQEELRFYQKKNQDKHLASIITELKNQAEQIAQVEIRKILHSFKSQVTPTDFEQQVSAMARSISSKILHQSISALKKTNDL